MSYDDDDDDDDDVFYDDDLLSTVPRSKYSLKVYSASIRTYHSSRNISETSSYRSEYVTLLFT